MRSFEVFALVSALLFLLSLYALLTRRNILQRLLALNVMGSAVFLLFGSIAFRNWREFSDPVPQAIVITGIVVAVSSTAFALVLAAKIGKDGEP
jgi:multicomponent Na+:H+ antiporter subunit C